MPLWRPTPESFRRSSPVLARLSSWRRRYRRWWFCWGWQAGGGDDETPLVGPVLNPTVAKVVGIGLRPHAPRLGQFQIVRKAMPLGVGDCLLTRSEGKSYLC